MRKKFIYFFEGTVRLIIIINIDKIIKYPIKLIFFSFRIIYRTLIIFDKKILHVITR